MADLVHRPEDQVFMLTHVAAKAGDPIVIGEHDEILSASFDAPYFYLVVRTPWYDHFPEHIDGSGGAQP